MVTDEDEGGGDGIYVVMAGLVKSSYKTPDGDTQVTPSTQERHHPKAGGRGWVRGGGDSPPPRCHGPQGCSYLSCASLLTCVSFLHIRFRSGLGMYRCDGDCLLP